MTTRYYAAEPQSSRHDRLNGIVMERADVANEHFLLNVAIPHLGGVLEVPIVHSRSHHVHFGAKRIAGRFECQLVSPVGMYKRLVTAATITS